jgi:TP901 family phage tail tape measure protein
MALGALGTGFGAYKAAGIAMDVERSQVDLTRILGGDRRASGRLGGQIQSMASYMPGIPMEKLYDVARLGAKLGIEDPAALRTFTRDMAKFGAILDESDIPLEEATERIASLMTIFDTGTGSADKFASAVLRLDAASVASARDILDVANRFSGPAAVFGMKPADALALATALRQAKVPVETAGTAIGQIFMRMASTKDMPAFARLAGMDRKSFAASLQDNPLDLLGRMSQNIAGMDPIAASRALDDLHLDGQRVRSTMIQLAQVFPLLNKYVGIANDEWQEAGMLNKGYAAASETTYAQIQLMQNQFSLLAVELGRGFLPIIKGATEGLGNFATDVGTFVTQHGPALEAWGGRMRATLEGLGIAWNKSSILGDAAWVTLMEKGEQAAEVMSRFGRQAWVNFEAGAANAFNIVKNLATGVGMFLGNLFVQIGDNLAAQLGNAFRGILRGLPGWMGISVGPDAAVKAVDPRGDLIKDPRLDRATGANLMKKMPGFDLGMMFGVGDWADPLPNRDAEQAQQAGRIAREVANQKDARQGRRGLDEIKAKAASFLGAIGWLDNGGGGGVGGGMGARPPVDEAIAAVMGGGGGGGGGLGGAVMGPPAGRGGPVPAVEPAASRRRRVIPELWRMGGGFGMGPQLPGPAAAAPRPNLLAAAGMMVGQAFGPLGAMAGMQAGAELGKPLKNRGGFEAAGPFSAFMRAQRVGRNRAFLGDREAFNQGIRGRRDKFNAFMSDPIARNAALFGVQAPGGGGQAAGQKPEDKAVSLLDAINKGIQALVGMGGNGARFAPG